MAAAVLVGNQIENLGPKLPPILGPAKSLLNFNPGSQPGPGEHAKFPAVTLPRCMVAMHSLFGQETAFLQQSVTPPLHHQSIHGDPTSIEAVVAFAVAGITLQFPSPQAETAASPLPL